MTARGQVSEGIAQMHEAGEQLGSTGQRVVATHLTGLLAEAHLQIGDFRQALHAIDLALDAAQTTAEHYFEPELYRIKGRALSVHPAISSAEAEASFEKAIELARKQQAKSYELRASADLARLLRKQGRTNEARERLRGIYSWFTEGFDTADLKDAKALLEELSSSP